MKQNAIKIQLKNGLEARPVAVFVQIASKFDCKVYVELADKKVNAKSIMGMMSLGLQQGETLTVVTDGTDEEAAMAEIEEFLSGSDE